MLAEIYIVVVAVKMAIKKNLGSSQYLFRVIQPKCPGKIPWSFIGNRYRIVKNSKFFPLLEATKQ
jgi:hypothetical protein